MIVFVKYFAIGVTAVAVHFLVMIILVEFLSVIPLLGSFFGFVIGSLVNYNLQYHWAFNSSQDHKKAFTRYSTITVSMLFLNLLIFQFGLSQLALDYRISQFMATAIVFLANFTINSRYTFK